MSRRAFVASAVLFSSLAGLPAKADEGPHDLIVVGGTAEAVEAAVEAKAAGRDVLLLAPRSYLGEDVAGTLSGVTAKKTPLDLKRELDGRLLSNKIGFRTWSPVTEILSNGVRVVTRGGARTCGAKEVRDCRAWKVSGRTQRSSSSLRVVRRVVSGERPDLGSAGTVEEIADLGEKKIIVCADGFPSVVTAKLWRCECDVRLPENTVRGRLAAEQEARDRTWTALQLDAADVCVSDVDRALAPCGEIDCDVLVAGAGTSGSPAAIAAARSGAKTVVCEWTYRMGGLTTDGMIAKYWYGNRCGFTTEIDTGHVRLGASFNQTKDEWFRREVRKAGGEILLGTLVSDVIVKSGRVVGAWIVLPTGERVRVNCKCVIDATGNADLAASAGEDTEFITGDELSLQGAAFMLKNLGMSNMNADFSFIDDTDAEDLFYVSLRGRCSYAGGWDQSQVVDTRERRRLRGVHYVTPQDVMNGRTYPDVICITTSNFDTHGQTVDPQFFLMDPPHRPPLQVNLPYRALLPRRTDGLLVVGLGMSAHRDAMPILRMQPDVQNQGYAAGLAAAMSVKGGVTVRSIDVKELQRKLVEKGIVPHSVLTMTDSYPIPQDRLADAVDSLADGYEKLGLVMADPVRSLPLLRAAYLRKPSLSLAHVLAMMGDRTGGGTLLDSVRERTWDRGWNYRGMGQFKRSVSLTDSLVIAIGRSRPDGGDALVRQKADQLTEKGEYSHFRAVALALESYGGSENAACLARLLRLPGVGGHAFEWSRDGAPAIRNWNIYPRDVEKEGSAVPDKERSDCLRELSVARALYRCGDSDDGLGERTLRAYACDPRKAYANHARKVLEKPAKVTGLDAVIPFNYTVLGGVEEASHEIRRINADTGFRRFFLTGPGFNKVMFGPFPSNTYEQVGRDIAEMKRLLSGTGIEVSWWCTPSIRYFSDFPSVRDSEGKGSKDNKKCPLDPAFAADFAAKVASVARVHPKFICIEDDYTLAWGRGLYDGACFCERHLADVARRCGRTVSGAEVAAAFRERTEANLPLRRAFGDSLRESLVSLARTVREAVDAVDPRIRIVLCQSGAGLGKDGDALEAVVRAFAGKTRPAVRPSGSIYGAETTPASIPGALSHTMWTYESLPDDIETFYEADAYPHNRFYSSSAQMFSMMAAAAVFGTDDYLLYCLQYLDDPLEDRGYADAYLRHRPQLEAVRAFIRSRGARLAGVRSVWSASNASLTRSIGYGQGVEVLRWNAYLCSKFGLPYTTRADGEGPALLTGCVAEVMSDEEILRLLKGGLLLDATAADLLQRRGFGAHLGVDVKLAEGRLPVVDEEILPASGCRRRGKRCNAFYIFPAGTEGSVEKFATLRPRSGTERWSRFLGVDGREVTPSVTFATNSLGGRVAVVATSLFRNRSSGLYNLRKQELFRNLLGRLAPDALPVVVRNAPGIWVLANVSADGSEMLVMANNLSGDVREGLSFGFAPRWIGAEMTRLHPDGSRTALGKASADWTAPFTFAQMEPEFLLLKLP